MVEHTCHAIDCTLPIAPELLMCPAHWRLVPLDLRRWVWEAYKPGQERRKDPTQEYLDVARKAIDAVAAREGKKAK